MFREEHFHITLSSKTPPQRFSRKHDMFWFLTRRFLTRNLYLFSWPNNYCCCRAVQGQLSKFTWINTVISFTTRVKHHKDLKGTAVFARRCFTRRLTWKIWQNIHSKETVMKSFSQLSHNLQIYWKRTPSVIFWWLLQDFS